jgi:hypothetical protein
MYNKQQQQFYMLTYLLPMGYISMVMMFLFNNQEGLFYIHNQVENHLKVSLMEDYHEEDKTKGGMTFLIPIGGGKSPPHKKNEI